MSDVDIVVVGSHAPGLFLRVKRPPVAGETVIGWDFQEPIDGGKGSNQAIAAARLGGKVAFVGRVGRDRIGDEGERLMREAGVDTRHLQRGNTSSGVGFILLDETGIPAMVTSLGANADLSVADIDAALANLPGGSVLLTQFEIPLEVALYAARAGQERGLTTIVNPAPAPDKLIQGLNAASVLVPNETEARALLGMETDELLDPEKMALSLHKRSGAGEVIITLGEQGAIGTNGHNVWMVTPPSVNVVDTSGAGDAFCAALAVGLVDGMTMQKAAQWACGVASLSVTRPGTIPSYPTLQDANRFLS
jgi:ribokinase